MKRKFTWYAWDFDFDGDAYVIAKDECPEKNDVPDYIFRIDHLHSDCKVGMEVQEGWCKFQCRTDWYDSDGKPQGWYVVLIAAHSNHQKGWFPVWIVRKGEWY
jgi:hypothetical protein